MKNEYRIFSFSRRFFFRYILPIQKEKEKSCQETFSMSLLTPCIIDKGHSLNR